MPGHAVGSGDHRFLTLVIWQVSDSSANLYAGGTIMEWYSDRYTTVLLKHTRKSLRVSYIISRLSNR